MRRLKLLFDAHVSPRIADPLRVDGYDIETIAHIPQLASSTDEALLEYAASTGRIVVTFNVRDFVPITASWLEASKDQCGVLNIVGISQNEFGTMIARLRLILAERDDPDDWRNLCLIVSRQSSNDD